MQKKWVFKKSQWHLDSNSNRQIVGIVMGYNADYSYFSKTSGVTGDLGVTILTR